MNVVSSLGRLMTLERWEAADSSNKCDFERPTLCGGAARYAVNSLLLILNESRCGNEFRSFFRTCHATEILLNHETIPVVHSSQYGSTTIPTIRRCITTALLVVRGGAGRGVASAQRVGLARVAAGRPRAGRAGPGADHVSSAECVEREDDGPLDFVMQRPTGYIDSTGPEGGVGARLLVSYSLPSSQTAEKFREATSDCGLAALGASQRNPHRGRLAARFASEVCGGALGSGLSLCWQSGAQPGLQAAVGLCLRFLGGKGNRLLLGRRIRGAMRSSSLLFRGPPDVACYSVRRVRGITAVCRLVGAGLAGYVRRAGRARGLPQLLLHVPTIRSDVVMRADQGDQIRQGRPVLGFGSTPSIRFAGLVDCPHGRTQGDHSDDSSQ